MTLEVSPLITLTHLLVAIVGFTTGWVVALRFGRKDGSMPEKERFHIPPGILILLTLVLILGGMAIQTYVWQREESKHDDCVEKWGQEMVANIDKRSNASFAQQESQARRSTALDDLLLFAIANPTPDEGKRPPKVQKQLDAEVKEYTTAVEDLRQKAAVNKRAREKFPFPHLDC